MHATNKPTLCELQMEHATNQMEAQRKLLRKKANDPHQEMDEYVKHKATADGIDLAMGMVRMSQGLTEAELMDELSMDKEGKCKFCAGWATQDLRFVELTGHSTQCPVATTRLVASKAYSIIESLTLAMEHWAADEDGIHPDAFDAYKRGKAVLMETVSDEEEAP